MNKTISINLCGMLFNLEEHAYERLSQYIQRLRQLYAREEGGMEIVLDIEQRIAELFQEKLKTRQVILDSDVQEVIAILGEPEMPESDAQPENAQSANSNSGAPGDDAWRGPKRLFRAPDEGMLGGVCAGISYYFNIDPVWMRIAFAAAFIFAGSGLLIYIILWIVLPKAASTADRLQMKGEAVNLSNIEKSIREEMSRIQNKGQQFASQAQNRARQGQQSAAGFFDEFFQSLGLFLRNLVMIAGKSLGVVLLLIGVSLLVAWFTIIISGGGEINHNGHEVIGFNFPMFSSVFFASELQNQVFLAGLAMVTFAPIMGLLLGGTRLVTPRGFLSNWPATINGSIFTIGFIGLIASVVWMLTDFRTSARILEPVAIKGATASDTLEIKVLPESDFQLRNQADFGTWKFFLYENEPPVMTARMQLNVYPSETGVFKATLSKVSRGDEKKSALKTAGKVATYIKQDGNTLWMNPYFKLPQKSLWRNQQVALNLYFPEGAMFRFHPGMHELVERLPENMHLEGEDLENQVFRMEADGLQCITCNASENAEN
jgi:phage shock protein PspC (stress-responsive transcriptional regulator)